MRKPYFDNLTVVYTIFITVYGLVLWALADKNSSVFTLEILSRDLPDLNKFQKAFEAVGVATAASTLPGRVNISMTTQANLIEYCVFPEVAYAYTTADIPNMTKVNINNFVNLKDSAIFDANWKKIDFNAWNRRVPSEPVHKFVSSQASPQYWLPWCKCVSLVLQKFSTDLTKTYDQANAAFKGCLATQHHVPRQKVAWADDVKEDDISSRKTMSRYQLLFILCTAYLINTIYSRMDFETSGSQFMNNVYNVTIIIIIVLMWALPVALVPSGMSKTTYWYTSSFMILPGFVMHLLLTEIVWRFIYNHKRRTSFIHPFVFYATILSLSFLALSENSVFTLEIYIAHYFLCNAVTLLYSALLFFRHYRCGAWTKTEGKSDAETEYTVTDGSISDAGEQNITAYFIICGVTGLVYIISSIPPYPVGAEQNIMWLHPLLFILVAFGGMVWVEHLYDGTSSKDSETDDEKLELTTHLVNLGHVIIIVLVLLYFTGQSMVTTYGDTYLPRGGLIPARAEFSLALKNSSNYLLLS